MTKVEQLLQFDIAPSHYININEWEGGWTVRELKGDFDGDAVRLVKCLHFSEQDEAVRTFAKMVLLPYKQVAALIDKAEGAALIADDLWEGASLVGAV